ncbi:hypothetical protein HDU67_003608, partial [Dinochytrium kinnereticum]
YVQCRFNNEILLTDPVTHSSDPIWDTELAWSIDSKPLGFLRSQRAKLKLVCFDIDNYNRRIQLGYIMLDLRAAAFLEGKNRRNPPAVFYPLLNVAKRSSPAQPFRPEIKIGFGIKSSMPSPVASPVPPPKRLPVRSPVRSSPAKPAVARKFSERENHSALSSPLPSRTPSPTSPRRPPTQTPFPTKATMAPHQPLLKPTITASGLPVEFTQAGYLQIGFSGPHWILNITVAFAEHLHLLSIDNAPAGDSQFYFYYTLFGTDIITETFSNLSDPRFPAERVSFRLRASESDLTTFFQDLPALPIHLCQAGKVLGYAEIPLFSIFDVPLGDVDESFVIEKDGRSDLPAWSRRRRRARLLERVCGMVGLQEEVGGGGEKGGPAIGVSLILAPDEVLDEEERRRGGGVRFDVGGRGEGKGKEVDSAGGGGLVGGVNLGGDALAKEDAMRSAAPPPTLPERRRHSEVSGKSPPPRQESAPSPLPPAQQEPEPPQEPTRDQRRSARGTSPVKAHPATIPLPISPWHQYRFSIDLRSVRGAFSASTGGIYLKYSYPAFGSTAPFITHPPVTPLGTRRGAPASLE